MVRKRLKIWIAVMASSSENEMGNWFPALWGETTGYTGLNEESLGRSGKFWIDFLSVFYCMIGLCHLMAGDDSHIAGGESRMTGDCCRPEGSIHRCVHTHSHLYSHIYGLVALLDNIQSSFSSITISTFSCSAWLSDQLWSTCLPQYMPHLRSYNYRQGWALQVELQ